MVELGPGPGRPADHRHRRRLRAGRRPRRRRRLDNWLTFGSALGMDVTPVRYPAPVGQAGGRRGQRPVPGRRAADRAVQRRGRGQRPCDVPGARAVPRHRRHLLQPDAGAAHRPGAHPRPDVHRPHADRPGGAWTGAWSPGWSPHDELPDAAREVLAAVLPHRTAEPAAVVKSSLDNYLGLYDRIGMKSSYSGAPEARSRDSWRSRSAAPRAGCIRICASTAGCRFGTAFPEYRI